MTPEPPGRAASGATRPTGRPRNGPRGPRPGGRNGSAGRRAPAGSRAWWTLPWRLVRALLLALAAFWFFIEEVGWRPLSRWLGGLASWGPWARLEARIAVLPPRPALLLFLLPVVLLFPVKLVALKLLHDGHRMSGIAVILAAKLVGTAIGGRLFVLLRRTLMQIRRFARAMAYWRLMRHRVRFALRTAFDWRRMQASMRRWGRMARHGFKRLGRWGRGARRGKPRPASRWRARAKRL